MTTNGYRSNVLLATLVIGTGVTWLSAWLTGLYVDPGNWPIRYTLFGIGFMIQMLLVCLWMRHLAREQLLAQRHFDALARMAPHDLVHVDEAGDLPTLPTENPWYHAAGQMRQLLAKSCRKAQEAEQVRASLEVRMQRLRSEQEQVTTVLNGLAEPVVMVDSFDEVVLANASAQALFQINPENIEERALAQLIHCEKLVELVNDTRRRRAPAQRYGELELVNQNGQTQWYSVTASTIANGDASEDTRSQGAVAVLRDIGSQKAAQKRNAEFVSAVSHEMKTPLSGIKAYVELLADGDAEDEQTREEFINVINAQADRLQRLIDNLLNLARIEAGVVNVSKQSRSLNELLEEAFNLVAPSAEAKQIKLTSDLSPMYLGVLADRDMMLQAAINLLSNAIKYTPDGGNVVLRSRTRDNEVVFEVEDTGVGLSEEDREKVFEKFYRVKKDRKMAQGTGLGLPLAKHIVEDVHGGHLTVDSQLGVGSTFRVTLPKAGQHH